MGELDRKAERLTIDEKSNTICTEITTYYLLSGRERWVDAEQCARRPIYTGCRKQQHASIWTQIEEMIIGTHACMMGKWLEGQ